MAMAKSYDANMSANAMTTSKEKGQSTENTTPTGDAKGLGTAPVQGAGKQDLLLPDEDNDAPVYLTGVRFWLITISYVLLNL
jgi:hypothetical protein